MKRQMELADRAQKKRKPGYVRIPLDKIGFWPANRENLGVVPTRVHQVAWDCATNKVRQKRYGHVDLVEIPAGMLADIQAKNLKKSHESALLPNAGQDIKYVCFSKTHFVHAMKLFQDGGRTLFNEGWVPIRLREDDQDGADILEQGPVCAIYPSSLLDDEAAAQCLKSEDNPYAIVQMADAAAPPDGAAPPPPPAHAPSAHEWSFSGKYMVCRVCGIFSRRRRMLMRRALRPCTGQLGNSYRDLARKQRRNRILRGIDPYTGARMEEPLAIEDEHSVQRLAAETPTEASSAVERAAAPAQRALWMNWQRLAEKAQRASRAEAAAFRAWEMAVFIPTTGGQRMPPHPNGLAQGAPEDPRRVDEAPHRAPGAAAGRAASAGQQRGRGGYAHRARGHGSSACPAAGREHA